MSRKEDFIQAGIDYRMEHGKPMAIGGDNFAEMAKEMNRTKPFEDGAEYGYQYAVDKVCEWLYDKLYTRVNGAEHYVASKEKITQSEFVEQIRKSLDE